MESIWSKGKIKTPVYLGLGLYLWGLLRAGPAVSAALEAGLEVCLRVLVPSLFPFLVFSAMAADTGLLEDLGSVLEKPAAILFRLPGSAGGVWLIGALGGYPLGVKAALDLYRSGGLTRAQAERLCGFCACCGPGFLLQTAGQAVFGSGRIGLFLLGLHWLGSLLVGFILTRDLPLQYQSFRRSSTVIAPLSAFTGAVRGAVRSCAVICGFFLFFRGLIALLPAGMPIWFLGFLEMSCGVTALTGLPRELPLAAAILGWGGLSVHFQAMDLLGGSDISPAFYWKGKLLHSAVSFVLCSLFMRFL